MKKNYVIVLLIFIGLIIVASVNKLSSDSIKKKEDIPLQKKVSFLTVDEAKIAILDETYEPYFSQLQEREIHTFTGEKPVGNDIEQARLFAREKFSSAVIPFTDVEKKCIQFTIDKIIFSLTNNNLNLMGNHPWKFIKIDDWLCGGYAHTRGDYIILSKRHLKGITSNWNENMTKEEEEKFVLQLSSLLVHEQMHSLQRAYKERFDDLYINHWNFNKIKPIEDEAITLNQLSNPDAPISEWSFSVDNKSYWLKTMIKEDVENPKMGVDFEDKIFILEQIGVGGDFQLKREKGVLSIADAAILDRYKNRFPVNVGYDHPNEISAYMFSEYFTSLLKNKKPFNNYNKTTNLHSDQFVIWVNNNMNFK